MLSKEIEFEELSLGDNLAYPMTMKWEHLQIRWHRVPVLTYEMMRRLAKGMEVENKVMEVVDIDYETEVATAIYKHDDLLYMGHIKPGGV